MSDALLPGDVISLGQPTERKGRGGGWWVVQYMEWAWCGGRAVEGYLEIGEQSPRLPVCHADNDITVTHLDESLAVPADCLLLHGSCIVNEALLTGESIPQVKVRPCLHARKEGPCLLRLRTATATVNQSFCVGLVRVDSAKTIMSHVSSCLAAQEPVAELSPSLAQEVLTDVQGLHNHVIFSGTRLVQVGVATGKSIMSGGGDWKEHHEWGWRLERAS